MRKVFQPLQFGLFFLAIACVLPKNPSSAQIISTFAGNGSSGFGGDLGPATSAKFDGLTGVAINGADVLIVDLYNRRVRKVDPAGIVMTIAGTGASGYSGDGGQATAATFVQPWGVAADNSGKVYISERTNSVIRVISRPGVINTIAGTGTQGYSGDGGPATAGKMNGPMGIAVDSNGNVYVADYGNHRVRKITASGMIYTVAGTGTAGYNGDAMPATASELKYPTGVAIDRAGNLYISEQTNYRIRKVTPSGSIRTIAGLGYVGFGGDGGPATAAVSYDPLGIAVTWDGDVYMSDKGNNRVRKITSDGTISSVAGAFSTGGFGGDGGPATGAQLFYPYGIAINSAGTLFICDHYNFRVRQVTCEGRAYIHLDSRADSVCPGDTLGISTTLPGGTWVSTNTAVATITGSGLVTGVSFGQDTIMYILSGPCRSDTVSFVLHVRNPVDCPSAVGSLSRTLSGVVGSLTIYPNPNDGSFSINLSSPFSGAAKVTITNILGQKVKEFSIATNKESDVKMDVPAGVYFISATVGIERFMGEIVVE